MTTTPTWGTVQEALESSQETWVLPGSVAKKLRWLRNLYGASPQYALDLVRLDRLNLAPAYTDRLWCFRTLSDHQHRCRECAYGERPFGLDHVVLLQGIGDAGWGRWAVLSQNYGGREIQNLEREFRHLKVTPIGAAPYGHTTTGFVLTGTDAPQIPNEMTIGACVVCGDNGEDLDDKRFGMLEAWGHRERYSMTKETRSLPVHAGACFLFLEYLASSSFTWLTSNQNMDKLIGKRPAASKKLIDHDLTDDVIEMIQRARLVL